MLQYVLLIQDDLDGAAAVHDALADSGDPPFKLEWLHSRTEGSQYPNRLNGVYQGASGRYSAIIVDISLADGTGTDTFEQVFRAAPQVPILILASERDEYRARLAVEHGAQDYLLKERLDSYSLPKALYGILERASATQAL